LFRGGRTDILFLLQLKITSFVGNLAGRDVNKFSSQDNLSRFAVKVGKTVIRLQSQLNILLFFIFVGLL